MLLSKQTEQELKRAGNLLYRLFLRLVEAEERKAKALEEIARRLGSDKEG